MRLTTYPGIGRFGQPERFRMAQIASELGMPSPDWLSVTIAHESGYSPTAENPTSHAVGLIQFIPSTAKALGTSHDELKAMSALQQFDYVKKYLAPFHGRLKNAGDVYLTLFYPDALSRDDSYIIASKDSESPKEQDTYKQNSILDLDKDGSLTAGDVRHYIVEWAMKNAGPVVDYPDSADPIEPVPLAPAPEEDDPADSEPIGEGELYPSRESVKKAADRLDRHIVRLHNDIVAQMGARGAEQCANINQQVKILSTNMAGLSPGPERDHLATRLKWLSRMQKGCLRPGDSPHPELAIKFIPELQALESDWAAWRINNDDNSWLSSPWDIDEIRAFEHRYNTLRKAFQESGAQVSTPEVHTKPSDVPANLASAGKDLASKAQTVLFLMGLGLGTVYILSRKD